MRPVVIYRLLSTGTLEEKLFQRQIAKGELGSCVERTATSSAEPQLPVCDADIRHFVGSDLKDLFGFCPDVPRCETFEVMQGRWSPSAYHQHSGEKPAASVKLGTAGAIDGVLVAAMAALHEEGAAPPYVHEIVPPGSDGSSEGEEDGSDGGISGDDDVPTLGGGRKGPSLATAPGYGSDALQDDKYPMPRRMGRKRMATAADDSSEGSGSESAGKGGAKTSQKEEEFDFDEGSFSEGSSDSGE